MGCYGGTAFCCMLHSTGQPNHLKSKWPNVVTSMSNSPVPNACAAGLPWWVLRGSQGANSEACWRAIMVARRGGSSGGTASTLLGATHQGASWPAACGLSQLPQRVIMQKGTQSVIPHHLTLVLLMVGMLHTRGRATACCAKPQTEKLHLPAGSSPTRYMPIRHQMSALICALNFMGGCFGILAVESHRSVKGSIESNGVGVASGRSRWHKLIAVWAPYMAVSTVVNLL